MDSKLQKLVNFLKAALFYLALGIFVSFIGQSGRFYVFMLCVTIFIVAIFVVWKKVRKIKK